MRARQTTTYLPILAGLVLLGVAVPGTASAKGPMDARVEGPGLATPISLNWEDESDLSSLIDATGFWELAEAPSTKEPAGDLGPRYVVSFSVHDAVGSPVTLALHAYPFAEPDPMVYAPAGQVYPMGEVPEGWRTATAALTAWFGTAGVTLVVAAAEQPSSPLPAAAAATPSNSAPTWPAVALGGAGVLVLAGLVTVAVRRREAAPAH